MILDIEDRLAVQDLYARYCFAFDLRDLNAWLDCFTADGELRLPGGGGAAGREALGAAGARVMQGEGSTGYHWNTNLLLDTNDGGTTGRCYLMFVGADGASGQVRMVGHYVDELVKQDGCWLFRRRELRLL